MRLVGCSCVLGYGDRKEVRLTLFFRSSEDASDLEQWTTLGDNEESARQREVSAASQSS